jgi:Putative adhesin
VNTRSVAIAALTAVTASGCGVGVHFADYRHTVTPADTHVSGTVRTVSVEAGAGHVVVRTGGSDGVTVHRVVRYESGTPHPSQTLTDGTLTFSNGCYRCRVDYDLTVPASVALHARTDRGRIDVTGIASADLGSDSASVTVRQVAGAVTVHSDSGRVDVRDVAGALQANTDSGSVTARNVRGAVTAHSDSGRVLLQDIGGALRTDTDSASIRVTGLRSPDTTASSDSGSIRLDFTAVPGSVRATNDSGSLHVALPAGTYDVDAQTDSGSRHITVPTSPAAPAKISLRTDSGGVEVTGPAS